MEFLQTLFGDYWEIIIGSSGSIIGVVAIALWKWIKNKSIGQALNKVSTFFTKDMNETEKAEFNNLAKSLASRKSMKMLNKLVNVLEQFDIKALQQNASEIQVAIYAILSVMIANGAFDSNVELKEKLEQLTTSRL